MLTFEAIKDPRVAETTEGMTNFEGVDKVNLSTSDIVRFNSAFIKTENCWQWKRNLDGGYGRFWAQNKTLLAHRVSYQIHVGEIPKGLQIDHLCRNRGCVNPDHLEPVTIAENVLRGIGITALNRYKTECPQGHPYDEKNTYISKQGTRSCIPCARQRTRNWRERIANDAR